MPVASETSLSIRNCHMDEALTDQHCNIMLGGSVGRLRDGKGGGEWGERGSRSLPLEIFLSYHSRVISAEKWQHFIAWEEIMHAKRDVVEWTNVMNTVGECSKHQKIDKQTNKG